MSLAFKSHLLSNFEGNVTDRPTEAALVMANDNESKRHLPSVFSVYFPARAIE